MTDRTQVQSATDFLDTAELFGVSALFINQRGQFIIDNEDGLMALFTKLLQLELPLFALFRFEQFRTPDLDAIDRLLWTRRFIVDNTSRPGQEILILNVQDIE